jgi:hypothetical protein
MDVSVISNNVLVDKVDNEGKSYYEFPDSYLFASLGYIQGLVEKYCINTCVQIVDGICESRRRFNEAQMAKGINWRTANLTPVMLRAVIKVIRVPVCI